MLTDKTIIVTGAASGIGRACAKRLVSDGNRVVAVDLEQDKLEKGLGSETANLKFAPGDVALTATATTAVAQGGRRGDGVARAGVRGAGRAGIDGPRRDACVQRDARRAHRRHVDACLRPAGAPTSPCLA